MSPVPSEGGDFSTPLRYGRNDESGARRHRHLERRIYEKIISRCFILLPLAGEVPRSGKGGGERSEPITRMLIMPCDTESQSRNADFISIAAERQSATLSGRAAVAP